MKTMDKINSVIGVAIIAAALIFATSCQKEKPALPGNPTDPVNPTMEARQGYPIIPPSTRSSYSVLSAQWWKWALELPVEGHPFVDDANFDVTEGQSGSVWYLAGVFGTVERTCTIPAGKALFVGLLNAEASNLEGLGNTYEEQRATAKFLADHISNVFVNIDGFTVNNIDNYRVASPQFTFTAPTPWIEGETGGTGTSVADGYYILLKPLGTGTHDLHYGGSFHFSIAEGDPFDFDATIDMTYHLIVE